MGVAPLASAISGRLTWSVRVLPKRISDQADPIHPLCPRSGKEPMQYNPANPLIVQGDRTILLAVDNPLHAEARDTIAPFAELEKSPEHIHTYRLSPLSLWNAAAAGMTAEEMVAGLEAYSKFPIPPNLPADLRDLVSRYGRVRLERIDGKLRLITKDQPLLEELARQRGVRDYLGERLDPTSFAMGVVNPEAGRIQALSQVIAHSPLPRQLLQQRLILGDQPELAVDPLEPYSTITTHQIAQIRG